MELGSTNHHGDGLLGPHSTMVGRVAASPRRRPPPPPFTPSPRQARPLLHGIRVTVDVARGMPPQAKPLALAKGGGRDNP